MLKRALDEERRVGDVLDGLRGRQVPARVVQEALAVVGGDDDQRPVVQALLAQAAEQRAEQPVGEAGLEQMPLVGLLEQVVVAPRGRVDQARACTSCGCVR